MALMAINYLGLGGGGGGTTFALDGRGTIVADTGDANVVLAEVSKLTFIATDARGGGGGGNFVDARDTDVVDGVDDVAVPFPFI